MLTVKEISVYYEPCDFDGDCDVCDNPEHGTYAVGYDSINNEVDSYICGKCASKAIPKLIEYNEQFYDMIDKMTSNPNSIC